MMTYREAIKNAAYGTLLALTDRWMWKNIGDGLFGIAVLLLRLLVFLTYPISTLLLAWGLMADERRTAEQIEALRKQLKDGIHRNGPSNFGNQP